MTTNDNAAIEERMREAENAEEPGDLKTGEVISGSPEMTMTTSELQSAGYVYVYDTNTADRSVVNRNMLQQALAKTRSDGSYVFSTRPPEGIEPAIGTYKCLLHADDENREKYTAMGLPVCEKHTLRSAYDVSMHMQNRHRREWQTIEGERDALERERQQQRDENIAEAMSILASRENPQNTRGQKDGKR
jgi:hypothetical protein|tara:strand:- start:276 stop:845 length:570 start_codon:yes stop_codon:yes gene_type:complete